MANTIWKEVFLIMCSTSRENARNTERFPLSLRITDDYALQRLCGEQHNLCNDDGKLLGMELNRALRDDDGEIFDAIAGPFLIVGLGDEDFDSLSDDLIEKYRDIFAQPEVFIRTNSGLLVLPYVTDEFVFSSGDEMER